MITVVHLQRIAAQPFVYSLCQSSCVLLVSWLSSSESCIVVRVQALPERLGMTDFLSRGGAERPRGCSCQRAFPLTDLEWRPLDFQACEVSATEQLVVAELQAEAARYVSIDTNGDGTCGLHSDRWSNEKWTVPKDDSLQRTHCGATKL